MRLQKLGLAFCVGIAMALTLAVAVAGAQNSGKKEYQFRGKVEKVDSKAEKVSVNGEKVEGWMEAMTMLYSVSNRDVLKKLKAGDQITAKVYDGDTSTLYDVKVALPKESGAR